MFGRRRAESLCDYIGREEEIIGWEFRITVRVPTVTIIHPSKAVTDCDDKAAYIILPYEIEYRYYKPWFCPWRIRSGSVLYCAKRPPKKATDGPLSQGIEVIQDWSYGYREGDLYKNGINLLYCKIIKVERLERICDEELLTSECTHLRKIALSRLRQL